MNACCTHIFYILCMCMLYADIRYTKTKLDTPEFGYQAHFTAEPRQMDKYRH